MSVTFAPRARMAVNASWPGVSRNVILRPSTSTWYAPMCCVMPPASVATTRASADRVEQRRLAVVDVAHDRDDRRPRLERLLRVVERLGLLLLVGGVLDRDLAPTSEAISSTSSSLSDWVAVRIWPRPMRILMMLGIGTPSACEKSRTLTPDSTETGPVGGVPARAARGRRLSWRACRCSRGGRAPPWSMTTRRRRPPAPPPPRGRSGRFGLLPPLAIVLQDPFAA